MGGELQSGLAVRCALDRIRVYSGVEPAASPPYVPRAFVPRGKPRLLTAAETRTLALEASSLTSLEYVTVVRLPIHLADLAASLSTGLPGEVQRRAERIEPKMLDWVRTLSSRPEPSLPRAMGLAIRRPGLLTSTFDHSNGGFVGLHVDSFFANVLERRGVSPNRLCVNAGTEPRRLLFTNLPLSRCRTMLADAGCHDPLMDEPRTKGLSRLFFEWFPDYPVLDLRVDPGEAYIAPTEDMIHDSSTLDRETPDLFLTYLGEFSAPALPADECGPRHVGVAHA